MGCTGGVIGKEDRKTTCHDDTSLDVGRRSWIVRVVLLENADAVFASRKPELSAGDRPDAIV